MKVLIGYDTKHGNTKKVAEMIGEGINSVKNNEVTVENVKNIDLNREETYDLIILGSPNHGGSHTRTVKKFLKGLVNAQLKVKTYVVFDTYMGNDFEKAVKDMEAQFSELMPSLDKASSGLSIKVGGIEGPIVNEDLPKCKEFGLKLAN